MTPIHPSIHCLFPEVKAVAKYDPRAAVVGLRASFPSFTEISPLLRLIISVVCKIVYPTAAAAPSSEHQGWDAAATTAADIELLKPSLPVAAVVAAAVLAACMALAHGASSER